MIQSFNCKETEQLFQRHRVKKWPQAVMKIGHRKLLILEAATDINDLKVPPGNKLEKLKGDRKGQYSIRINDQWRICFQWKAGHAHQVEIVDYHS